MMTPSHRATYLPYIDGLRAIAVLAVVLYHLAPEVLPGGFAGVDVFFVISGFVVTISSLSRGGNSPLTFLGDFLARRFLRILPALVVCLLVTSWASALWIPASWLSDSIPRTGRLAFFGMSNIELARNANDYFSPVSTFNPFTHTWSLAVEEQFYLAVPLLLWGWTCGGRWRIGAGVILAMAAVASGAYAWMGGNQGGAAYYLLTTRFWELAAGVALGWLLGNRKDVSSAHGPLEMLGTWTPPVALIALGIAFASSRPDSFPGRGAWLPMVATALLIAALHGQGARRWLGRLLGIEPLRRIGELSYSLYLWHWPIFVLFRWTVGLEGPLHMLSALMLSFGLAWVSQRFIERPFKASPGARRPARTIGFGVLAVAIAAFTAQTLQKQQHRISPSVVAKERADWYPSRALRLRSPSGCSVSPHRVDLPLGWHQTFERVGCPAAVSAPKVFVVGDSHALAYGPLFARYAMETGATVTVYNNGGCPLLSLQGSRESSAHCIEAADLAIADLLPRLGPSDVIFLPSLRVPRYVEQGWVMSDETVVAQVHGAEAQASRRAASLVAVALLHRLRQTGAHVSIQAPNLLLKAPLFRCADWWNRGNPICEAGTSTLREEFEVLRAPVLADLESLAKADDDVTIFDPLPSLCPEGTRLCDGFRDGRPLFFDGDHLSAYGSQVIYPAFVASMWAARPTRGEVPSGTSHP